MGRIINDMSQLAGGLIRNVGGFGGFLVTGPNAVADEMRGLGDVATRWPEVRVIGTPEEYLEADHSRVVVNFKVPYYERGAFIGELLGWPYQTAGGYRRHLPEPYRNWSWQVGDNWALDVPVSPVMYCTKAVAKGHGLRDDWVTQNPDKLGGLYYPDPQFKWSIVTAVFETLTFDVLLLSEITETPQQPAEMQRFCYKTEDASGRYIQFAIGTWKLKHPTSGATMMANTRNQNFWEVFETVTYEWYDVLPGMTNHDRNQGLCGMTNSVQFDNYPAETLILQRAGRQPRKSPFGQRTYLHRFEFLRIPTGVNKALPPGPPTYTPEGNLVYWDIVASGTENATTPTKPYRGTDLTVIFKP